MVRKHVFALAAAIAIAVPSVASAQLSGTLTAQQAPGFQATVSGYSGVGGGFNGVFTDGSTTITFDDFLFWCVDPERSRIDVGNYDLYTFDQFVNANPFGFAGSFNDVRNRSRRIASGVDGMIAAGAGNNGAPRAARNAAQEIAWENFVGAGSSGNSSFNASRTFVLVRTPISFTSGVGQTYMFQSNALVPEPASIALLASGLLGFGIIARRRKA